MGILDYLSACIVVDGQPCQEYDVEVSEPAHPEANDLEIPRLSKLRPRTRKQISGNFEKYIQCDSDSHFEVKTEVSAAFDFGAGDAVDVDIFFNGKYAGGMVHIEEDFESLENGFYSMICQGSSLDHGRVIQRFKFGSITTREELPDDDLRKLKVQHKDLGTIGITFRRVQATHHLRRGAEHMKTDFSLEDIPAKVVKGDAISIAAGLGDTIKGPGGFGCITTKYIDENPIATFVFRCRSKKDLQQLLVIPRSPSSVPLEHRPVEELSLDEARELIRLQQALAESTKMRIKQEEKEANLNDLRSLQRRKRDINEDNDAEVEVLASRSKRRRLLPTAQDEVINLSD